MKWITAEQVKAYATTPERALDISVRHHQQNVDATEAELATQAKPLNGLLCGLCRYYDRPGNGGCVSCPLGENDFPCGYETSLYRKALNICESRPRNHAAFIKAETALLNELKSLQSGDKSMDKKKKLEIQIAQNEKDQEQLREVERELKARIAEAEVTYSIGDRFKREDGNEYILIAVCGANSMSKVGKGRDEIRFASLKTGHTFGGSVDDCHAIRPVEIKSYLTDYTRIWDARREVHCAY